MLRSSLLVLTFAFGGVVGFAPQLPGPVRTEPPVARGSGATLFVTVPEELCRSDVEMIVARTINGGRAYVFQTPVTPPVCEWVIEDARPGEYQAVVQMARGDRRVVAMSQFELLAGTAAKTLVASLQAVVEGLISVEGIPVGAGTHVEVKQNGGSGWSWEATTDTAGYYKLAVMPYEHMCIRVRLPEAINPLSAGRCRDIGRGTNRQDLDIPGGRVEVTLVPRDGPIHETPLLLVLNSPGRGISVGVTVTGRTVRTFVGLERGKHTVKATTMDYAPFDVAEVLLTRDEPVRTVTLSVPYSR